MAQAFFGDDFFHVIYCGVLLILHMGVFTKFEADVKSLQGLSYRLENVADLFEWSVHLRLLARNPPHKVGVEPGVQELRPVADTPLVWSQGDLVSRVELARPNLQSFGDNTHVCVVCYGRRDRTQLVWR